MTTPRRPLVALVSLVIGCSPGSAGAPEYAVKAGYLYNFAKFVDWPASEAMSEMTVCIYGKSALQGFLEEAVRGKLVHGLPISVRRLDPSTEDWGQCRLIFFSGAQAKGIETVLSRLQSRPIVTVGECEAFVKRGGMIGLFVERGQVRFNVNLTAVAAAHLEISSRLVELARGARPDN
jgi:hypothetical protein